MCAFCSNNHSTISRLPVCAPAPIALSQSPSPQFITECNKAGSFLKSLFTSSKSLCAAIINSLTSATSKVFLVIPLPPSTILMEKKMSLHLVHVFLRRYEKQTETFHDKVHTVEHHRIECYHFSSLQVGQYILQPD